MRINSETCIDCGDCIVYCPVGAIFSSDNGGVIPADKPDEYTELIYEELELNIEIPDEFFSISHLKRR